MQKMHAPSACVLPLMLISDFHRGMQWNWIDVAVFGRD